MLTIAKAILCVTIVCTFASFYGAYRLHKRNVARRASKTN